jgi:S-formylglutathione hydrolase FrmB
MVMPELLEVFGRFEPHQLPSSSSLDLKHIQANNPLTLVKNKGISQLPTWLYLDYGSKEGFDGITVGNRNFEEHLKAGNRQVPVQPFNGNSEHNYRFWRSRSGNILQHHSDVLQKTLPGK